MITSISRLVNFYKRRYGVTMAAYSVALVGEQHYRDNVTAIAEGDDAQIWIERNNPYDDLALAVTAGGRTIGYIPRDSFLRDAIHDERKGCLATVLKVEDGHSTDFRHVTIEAELFPKGEKAIPIREFGGK